MPVQIRSGPATVIPSYPFWGNGCKLGHCHTDGKAAVGESQETCLFHFTCRVQD